MSPDYGGYGGFCSEHVLEEEGLGPSHFCRICNPHSISTIIHAAGLPVRWPAKQGDLAGEPTEVTKVKVNLQLWCRLYLQFFINVDVKGLPLEGL